MPDETHKLQKDPPEGSRKVIDHELERQSREQANINVGTGNSETANGEDADKGRPERGQ
ncbi:MAG: hypothetical protein H0T75_18580 [Rhizobiales bacterium]|nr:hypothetical protein [Hyphomicrobiales bacterium]MDQ3560919.1 hypothetical protein [Pseudomonadota bacterium]